MRKGFSLILVIFILLAGGCGGGSSNNSVSASSSRALAGREAPPTSQGEGSGTSVTTYHNDILRTGAYPAETVLTPTSVSTTTFGKLFNHETNGQIEAEPLYVPGVSIAGKGLHNAVFIATLNAYVYAFDADNATGVNVNPLWTANLGPAAPAGTGGGGDTYEQGIASTPVIDLSTRTMYVVSKNGSGSSAYFQLHALDIASGTEKFGGPMKITASVSGTVGGVNGSVILQVPQQYQRVGLLLLNGVVYIGIGGLLGDTAPCRGWILGYDRETLHQVCVYTTAPDAGVGSQTAFAGSSVWMSGCGLTSDGTYIYCATGNGDFDANKAGGKDYGDSILRLYPTSGTLAVSSYFTPYNQQTLDSEDRDVGSGGLLLVPDINLLVQTSKTGEIYVLNRSKLGGYNAAGDQVFQEIAYPGGFWASPAYAFGRVYFASEGRPLVGYNFSSAGMASSAFGTSVAVYAHATPSISYNAHASNPASTAIVWIVQNNDGTALLHAYNGATMSEVYNSGNSRDTAGGYIKFGVPTVADGKAFVPCTDGLYVYGVLGTGRAGSSLWKER